MRVKAAVYIKAVSLLLIAFITTSNCYKFSATGRNNFRQGSHASRKVLDFFLENSRTRKVPENHFGPGN